MLKFVLLLCVVSASANYSGHQILEVRPQNENHIAMLQQLAQDGSFDILNASPEQYTIMVSPQYTHGVSALLRGVACEFTVSDINIEKEINEEAVRLLKRSGDFNYNDFNDLTTINKEMDRLAAKCLAGFVCRIDSIGNSIENRPLRRLKISKEGTKRKAVWIDATTHAREWLTTSSLMMMIRHLLENYHSDKEAKYLMDTYDFHLIPIANPDGYSYTWKGSRMWRKNMRRFSEGYCFGVDLNRNADYAWNTGGSSSNPCSETYHGTKPASEPEIVAVQNALKESASSIVQYISLHSYGNYWLTSFGSIDPKTKRCVVSKEDPEMLRVANAAANAIEKQYNTRWKRGPSCKTIYPTSGGMLDYAKAVLGIRYGAVPEVRGPSFVVPPTAIVPSFKEMFAGLVASMKAIEQGSQ